jgi:hypothetical protein
MTIPLVAQVPDHVPPKRLLQIENGFGINSDLPQDALKLADQSATTGLPLSDCWRSRVNIFNARNAMRIRHESSKR